MITNSQYLHWDKIENVLVPITANTLNILEFFQNPSFGMETKIVGISSDFAKGSVMEGFTLVDVTQLDRFTLNLLDSNGKHVLKDFPCKDLCRSENNGRIRIFDIHADLRKSYVQNTAGNPITPPGAIAFTFYTTKKAV